MKGMCALISCLCKAADDGIRHVATLRHYMCTCMQRFSIWSLCVCVQSCEKQKLGITFCGNLLKIFNQYNCQLVFSRYLCSMPYTAANCSFQTPITRTCIIFWISLRNHHAPHRNELIFVTDIQDTLVLRSSNFSDENRCQQYCGDWFMN